MDDPLEGLAPSASPEWKFNQSMVYRQHASPGKHTGCKLIAKPVSSFSE
jgi:hypothetical protein